MIPKVIHFYVYMYLDSYNIPFYVGKGIRCRWRLASHINNSNEFLRSKILEVGKANVKIHFLHKNLTEEEAFFWEKYWIQYIGRRDLKEGTLCNLTDGGESGPVGYRCTEEKKRKLSLLNKGKIPANKGMPHTKETKQRMRAAHVGMTGKHHSENAKCKIGDANRGALNGQYGKPSLRRGKTFGPLSEEIKRKISRSNKGKNLGPHSEEHRQNLSNALKGRIASKETRLKMGVSQRIAWRKRKNKEF